MRKVPHLKRGLRTVCPPAPDHMREVVANLEAFGKTRNGGKVLSLKG